jgi:hypothetical protein
MILIILLIIKFNNLFNKKNISGLDKLKIITNLLHNNILIKFIRKFNIYIEHYIKKLNKIISASQLLFNIYHPN